MQPLSATDHELFMRIALDLGEQSLAAGETPVGCVLVHKNEIIGTGINDTNASMNGTRHAEFLAFEQALAKVPPSAIAETDLYVTVEPCIMCASFLRQYHIRHVYFGCANERFGGTQGVLSLHSDSSIDPPFGITGGIFRKEAIMLLRKFYFQENNRAPKPRSKKNRQLNTEFEEDVEVVSEKKRRTNTAKDTSIQ